MKNMTFGIHLGHLGGPIGEMRRLWMFADRRGFDWFSVSDHFQESPPQGGDKDCFEAVATMAAAATETSRVRIGCLVFCISYRHPGLLAKVLTTMDHLSGGRVECGLGAGWHEDEYRAFGIPFERIGVREDQLEEYALVLRGLLSQPACTFNGRHFRLEGARCRPRPLQQHLRIWIGGAGERRTLRAAARYADGWNAPYLDPSVWRAKNEVLNRWCEQEDRDPATLLRSANVGFYMGADRGGVEYQQRRFRQEWGAATEERKGFLLGNTEAALEMVAAYREAGVERLNLALRQGPYDWDALEAFAEAALPPH